MSFEVLSVWAWYHRKKLCANVTCGLNRLLHILGHWCECIYKACVIEEIKERDSEEQWLQSLCFGYQHFGLQVRIHLKDITEIYRKFYLQMLLHNMQTGVPKNAQRLESLYCYWKMWLCQTTHECNSALFHRGIMRKMMKQWSRKMPSLLMRSEKHQCAIYLHKNL